MQKQAIIKFKLRDACRKLNSSFRNFQINFNNFLLFEESISAAGQYVEMTNGQNVEEFKYQTNKVSHEESAERKSNRTK